jgi:hypothetical protein
VPPPTADALYDDGHARVVPPRPGDVAATTLAEARARFDESTDGGSGIPNFELGRVTFADGAGLVAPWESRLAWYAVVTGSACPRPGDPTAGSVYAVDATGVGDGVVYDGPVRRCDGHFSAPETRPLARAWSARWRVVSRTRTLVRLAVRSRRCPGLALTHVGVAVDGTDSSERVWRWAETYPVPYGATGCADGPEEPDVVERYYGRDGAWPVPRLTPARLGWIRVVHGQLVPVYPQQPAPVSVSASASTV